ncbi:MAG: hypothetical protein LBF40_10860 [Deltaproteobacteria bacterium]|jgi:hypothetical protein|nr:hypothetical protein [Deltaproteobacteria bacterium]
MSQISAIRKTGLGLAALAILLACALAPGPLFAQAAKGPNGDSDRESLDLNTIATLSVALVFQAYGYIGTYADLLSTGVYEADRVNAMLKETTIYLQNSRDRLTLFQTSAMGLSSGDKKYIAEVVTILDLLISEAQSLSAFALNHNENDLKQYEASKTKAWSSISKLLRSG